MLADIARRYGLLTRPERVRWAAIVPLGLAAAALEALGGALVFALLARLFEPAAARGRLLDLLQPYLPDGGSPSSIVALAAGVSAIHISKNILLAAAAWWRARIVAMDTAALSTRLFGAYLHAPWPFHLRRNAGVLMESLRGSARPYFEVFESAATVLIDGAVIAAIGTVAILAAPPAVTAAAAAVVILAAGLVRAARRAQRIGGERSARLGAALYRHVQHGLGAVKEATVLGRGGYFVRAFERDARSAARLDVERALLDAMPRLVLESAFVLAMLALVAWGAAAGDVVGVIPLVSLYAYTGFRVLPAANRIALQMNALRWNLGASAPLLQDLARLDPVPRRAPACPRLELRDALGADRVSFTYEGAASPALVDVSLSIRRGESVAIAGATGAGKTTLVDLLIGLLPPASGRVLVDGEPIDGRVEAWQRNVGYVPQSPFILDDTLRRNVALGVPDDEIDEAAVARAVSMARLDDVAAALPCGLDTPLGEHGVRLSGGERQRVAIARALYGEPDVLVFDEATSALDPGTEMAVAEAIESLRGRRTILIVAHRLTTVARCDRVLLLSGGRVEAEGSYADLAGRSSAFRAVAALR